MGWKREENATDCTVLHNVNETEREMTLRQRENKVLHRGFDWRNDILFVFRGEKEELLRKKFHPPVQSILPVS